MSRRMQGVLSAFGVRADLSMIGLKLPHAARPFADLLYSAAQQSLEKLLVLK
jgi:hypothetical protein